MVYVSTSTSVYIYYVRTMSMSIIFELLSLLLPLTYEYITYCTVYRLNRYAYLHVLTLALRVNLNYLFYLSFNLINLFGIIVYLASIYPYGSGSYFINF